MTRFYAHTKFTGDSFLPEEQWEPLFTPDCGTLTGKRCKGCEGLDPSHGHLNKVAHLSGKFAAEMFPQESKNSEVARQWGQLAGWWHDLGKFAPEWQDYLKSKADPHADEVSGKVDHSTAGAQFAVKAQAILGHVLAYCIAGHHAGLPNGIDASNSHLDKRLKKQVAETSEHIPETLRCLPQELPPFNPALQSGHALGFFIRLVFSALVDADFLATEAFMNPEKFKSRPSESPSMTTLEITLNTHLAKLTSNTVQSPVNIIRSQILSHCKQAAEQPTGLFSLTVPTGGGKTLSSLAFAVKHARLHKLRRIIYVIPFTSIIEQNADVFRRVFDSLGDDIVLEHHSSFDPDTEHANFSSRLSAENWDASIVVTTNVQFFESLHANKTSRCRKLHRLPQSVIILDEAQALPLPYLNPCLRQIEELTTNYNTSVVLCTATQPAIHKRGDFKIGLSTPHEIIPDPIQLYSDLQRVESAYSPEPINDLTLVEKLFTEDHVLCIVNTRRHAREIFEALPEDGSRFHLSALMCPEHRSEIMDTIKARLRQQKPVRLISTQLIEAGVDIDFPVVYRALAGLDSIAQAAGRCDREGLLSAKKGAPGGKLFVFVPEEAPPPPFIKDCANAASQTLAKRRKDILGLDAILDYFTRHFWDNKDATDQNHILDTYPKSFQDVRSLLCFEFKKCAENFKLIDDYSEAVLIPHGEKGQALCETLRRTFDPAEIRKIARRLQRFSVNIPKPQHDELLGAGILYPVHDERFFILNSTAHYDKHYGLHPKADLTLNAKQTIL